jgi:hypothetical protein
MAIDFDTMWSKFPSPALPLKYESDVRDRSATMLDGHISQPFCCPWRDVPGEGEHVQHQDTCDVERGVGQRDRESCRARRGQRREQRSDRRADIRAEGHRVGATQGDHPRAGHRDEDRRGDARRLHGHGDHEPEHHCDGASSSTEKGVDGSFHAVGDERPHVAGDQREGAENDHQTGDDHEYALDVPGGSNRTPEVADPRDGLLHPCLHRTLPIAPRRADEMFTEPFRNVADQPELQLERKQDHHCEHVEEVVHGGRGKRTAELARVPNVAQ